MDLETQTDRRLRAAGFTEDDPGLTQIRTWNALVFARRSHGSATSGLDCGRRSDSGGGGADSPVAARQRTGSQHPAQPANVAQLDAWRKRYHPSRLGLYRNTTAAAATG